MQKIIDLIQLIVPIAIVVNILVSLVIAVRLYRSAPENQGMGFNKYWQTLMMDAAPGTDKKLLTYDDKDCRNELFKSHQVVSITCMVIVGICVLIGILS
ncbi:MAG: hypothetical protein EOO07_28755 [Chitinophagaceae bacterium]|nr:MAG: hypothetical protein EOO07_28755 [Chitinophagaceae bacterium]